MDLRFAIVALLVAPSMCLDCPVGWASYNGECFHFSKSTASWLDAQAACRQMGGYLATDDNKEKHDFLTNIASVIHSFGETVFWLGGDDYLFEGVWRWEETGGPVVSFTKWAPGYPTNSSDTNCLGMVFVDTELMWKDMTCGSSHHGKRQATTVRPTKHHKVTHAHRTHPPSPNHYYICEKQAFHSAPVIG